MSSSQGSVLMIVVLMVFVMAVSAAAFLQFGSTEIIQVKAAGQSMRAFYISESGLQLGIHWN